jgi:dihydrofolate synthase/folylpolyglutamate synthase
VTAQHLPGDQAFFSEWAARRPGERRSLERARAVGEALGTWDGTPPVLAVVGSKGKGTAAVHAAATLSAAVRPGAGRRARVGLVTSPGLRTNRERMRFDGAAISPAGYEAEAARLVAARDAVGPDGSGYLSPTGAYTVTGAAWAAGRGADALVLEEGLGGRSDEVSLFEPRVVAVTRVFYEHGDLLGPTLDDVARDLLGVVGHGTRTIVTVEQDAEVTALVAEAAAKFGTGLVTVGWDAPSSAPAGLAPLTRLNATAGEAAARALAAELGWSLEDADVAAALRTVRVPGRMSRYRTGNGPVMVDGAISPEGVRATVESWRAWRSELGLRPAGS